MTHRYLTILIALFICLSDTYPQGYYKDVFMDGGIRLTSMERLPAANLLELSIEHFASSRYTSAFPPTKRDSVIQDQLFIGSETDLNGVLLYPDGEPRFRVIFVNGGKAASHGLSLKQEGLDNIRTFLANGGSYVGTCAGAFLASAATLRSDTAFPREHYLQIWPGVTRATGLLQSYTGMKVVKDSPLLKYSDFGGDMYIDSVRHNGGCLAYKDVQYPPETEVLLTYDYPAKKKGTQIDGETSAWAYKKSESTGRVVVIGSHPEGITSGERLHLMASMIQYALEGNGAPEVKGELANGSVRKMFKSTLQNNPDSTMIGDKQYHHFTVMIPHGARNLKIKLEGAEDYDLFLYFNKGDFAFRNNSDYKDISLGASKVMSFDKPDEGFWYIGVECNNTVSTVPTPWGYEYTGCLDVLNGVPYSIAVTWD
jgi:glutamine amidotransferase-like uncharacterized protein